eukprot:14571037-Ditylum_brightwellii.AAC.2
MSSLSEEVAGLPRDQSIFFAKTPTKLKYHMVKAYGPSDQINTQFQQSPVHSVGQGPCNAPSKWTCTINAPLRCYDKFAHGCIIKDPTNQLKSKHNAKMYVDNNKTMHNNGIYDTTAAELMQFVDKVINLWDGLLWITGG